MSNLRAAAALALFFIRNRVAIHEESTASGGPKPRGFRNGIKLRISTAPGAEKFPGKVPLNS